MEQTLKNEPATDRPMSVFQIMIVAICFILNFNDGIDVLIVSFSSAKITETWNLSKTEMGYIFSAGLAGMTLGCLLLAPWADKIGRRKLFMISLVLISSGMFGVAFCSTYTAMLLFRFLTGWGIGGILPTMAATAAEFSNARFRDFNVGLVQAGWPIGAVLTGFFCAWFIPQYGWQAAFMAAGIMGLLMLGLVYFFMVDSVEFLLKTRPAGALEKINAMQQKMGLPAYQLLPALSEPQALPNLKALFSPAYKDTTLKSWVAAFFGFMTLYALMSWVPNIAKDAGLPFEAATYVGVALNVGAALGSASIGAIGSRFGLQRSILTYMLSAFAVMVLYANVDLSTALIFVLIFLIGIFVQGGFNGIWPLLSRVYPAEIRATGIGFALGTGRFGAILGPTLFGLLADHHISVKTLFVLFSTPLLVMGFSIWQMKPMQQGDRM